MNIITALTESQWFSSIMGSLAAYGVPIVTWVGKRHPGLAFAKYIARAMAARDASDTELENSLFVQTATGLGLKKLTRSQFQLEPFPAQTQLALFTLTSVAGSPDTTAAAGDVTVGQVGSSLEWVNAEPFTLEGGKLAVVLFAATTTGPEYNITNNAQLELRTTIIGASVDNRPVGAPTAVGVGTSGLLLYANRAGVSIQILNNGPNMALSVGENLLTGVITVIAATDGGGVITSTANQVRQALEQVPELLVYAKNFSTGNGLIAASPLVDLEWNGSYIQQPGAPEEDEDSIRARDLLRFMGLGGWAGDGAPPAPVATDEGLEYWARQPPAGRVTSPVKGVRVLSNWLNGVISGNDITVILWGALGALSVADVAAVDGNFYNGRKFSLGADLHTRTVTNVAVPIVGTIVVLLDAGYTEAEVRAAIAARIAIYQASKAIFPGCTIRREAVSAKCVDALPDGVVTDITLSMPVDHTYTYLEYPILDSSTLTVALI